MHITSYLGLPLGHRFIPFVDVTTSKDSQLFLDPCLIERGMDPLSKQASALIADFEDALYADMRWGNWHGTTIFNEAHEINDTKLGYGNGRNGKGKTPTGMRDSLSGLYALANGIPSISRIQDISVFVEDFAEDCMSDLLTNILRLILCQFTAKQMLSYGKQPAGLYQIRSWDSRTYNWIETEQPYWVIDGRRVLLVPKWWVRKRFLFNAHQYLCRVIIERMRKDSGYDDLSKEDIWRNMERDSRHWEYNKVIEYTRENPDALIEYHNRMPRYYNRANGCMDDDALDEAVYGYRVIETA